MRPVEFREWRSRTASAAADDDDDEARAHSLESQLAARRNRSRTLLKHIDAQFIINEKRAENVLEKTQHFLYKTR